ncbi:flagellar protein FliS [Yoonia vestfoldensis]|uniref:Flagellar protein FliS n=2 Tax=Yoonia vestfoldensis TaxID=245188 RepID=A0A1Y0E6Z8_9RHOB|nr:flagellar protein FliS [Yoonia vestfoldensis]
MTMLSPAAEYQRQQQNPGFNPDDAHQLIKVTLEYLVRSLGMLAQKPARDSEIFKTHIARVLTATYVLQSSLDFERGGEIAANLFHLYEYSRQQTLKLMRNDDTAQIDKAHHAISEIFVAWQQIH